MCVYVLCVYSGRVIRIVREMAKRNLPTDSAACSSTAKHRTSSFDPRWRIDFTILHVMDFNFH